MQLCLPGDLQAWCWRGKGASDRQTDRLGVCWEEDASQLPLLATDSLKGAGVLCLIAY